MFLPIEELQEVRIFRSRVIRITEHKLACPEHLQREIASVVKETVSVRKGTKTIFQVDRSIVPMVTYLSRSEISFENEPFADKNEFVPEDLLRLIELLK